MQSIRIISLPPSRIKKWSQLSQFRWTSTKVILIEKLKLATFQKWAKVSRERETEREGESETEGERETERQRQRQRETDREREGPDIATVFHAGCMVDLEIQNLRWKKLHGTNQGSNYLWSSFTNKDNAKARTHLEEKDNPSILKDDFLWRTDPSIFTHQ